MMLERQSAKLTAMEQSDRRRQCDQRALPVAQAALAASQAELVILFGSRARGDYAPRRSDIDILLIQSKEPDCEIKEAIAAATRAAAQRNYGAEVPIQLVWSTLAEFRQQRRYVNSLETNAVRDGVIMPRNQAEYNAQDFEDEEVEVAYDWSTYSERLRQAEQNVLDFQNLDKENISDDLVGYCAQRALENSMKALLEAHGVTYRYIHNLGGLLGKVRENDPELRDFRLSIPPDIYSAYAGDQSYKLRVQPRLNTMEGYIERTVADAQRIIARAKQIREQKEQPQNRHA